MGIEEDVSCSHGHVDARNMCLTVFSIQVVVNIDSAFLPLTSGGSKSRIAPFGIGDDMGAQP